MQRALSKSPKGTKDITTNGTHNVEDYEFANVSVPLPSGTISITSNGTHNVTNYASASVNVSHTPGIGTYNCTGALGNSVSIGGVSSSGIWIIVGSWYIDTGAGRCGIWKLTNGSLSTLKEWSSGGWALGCAYNSSTGVVTVSNSAAGNLTTVSVVKIT